MKIKNFNQFIDEIRQIIAQGTWAALSCTANDGIINFVYDKEKRYRHLQKNFKSNFSGKVYLSNHACYENVSLPFNFELKDFVKDRDLEDWSIVVLQNNTINYQDKTDLFWSLKNKSPNSFFVCWDYDNHHWAMVSTLSALLVDMYIPAHTENVCSITRLNSNSYGPIPCGTLQWSKKFALENIDVIQNTNRSNEPLGHHFKYDHFAYRNGLINKVNTFYKDVALIPSVYHERDQLSRLKEWSNHKVHWVMPVFNDLPLRLFDALFTGGIPIIPNTLRGNKHIEDIEDHCVFYGIMDIVDPKPITELAISKFDKAGIKGVNKRTAIAMNNHHIDVRFAQIFKHIGKELNIKF